MKKMSKTIVFFGNERLATGVTTTAPTLKALIAAGYNVAAVVSSNNRGQSRNPRNLEISQVAEEHNIPVLLPNKLVDISTQLKGYKPDVGVLVAFGKIVPGYIIDIFPTGIVNIHPSLLPFHRGPAPIESTILRGESRSGVSLMQLTQDMDAGPLYVQKVVKLKGNEQKQALCDLLINLGSGMLIEHLPVIVDGRLTAKPQNSSQASYDKLISKNDGLIDWTKPAYMIEREIRAYLDWPKSFTKLEGKDVIVTEASTIAVKGVPGEVKIINKQLVVYCGENALIIHKLKPAGKNEMSGEAFLAGHFKKFK